MSISRPLPRQGSCQAWAHRCTAAASLHTACSAAQVHTLVAGWQRGAAAHSNAAAAHSARHAAHSMGATLPAHAIEGNREHTTIIHRMILAAPSSRDRSRAHLRNLASCPAFCCNPAASRSR